jgi:hypothetical protein
MFVRMTSDPDSDDAQFECAESKDGPWAPMRVCVAGAGRNATLIFIPPVEPVIDSKGDTVK